jgi:quinol monooxygenase YgiN
MALVYVMALITGKDDSKSELEKELKAVIPTVRKEDGCLRYDLHLSADGKPLFMFYETWQSKEALAAHSKAPHMLAMRDSIKGLVAGPLQVTIWSAVDVVA